MTSKPKKKPMPVTLTEEQKQWLKDESEKTGETMTAVMRALIQKQIKAGK